MKLRSIGQFQRIMSKEEKSLKPEIEEKDFQTCLKVLEEINKHRHLLADEKFLPLVEKGKELFQPRSIEEKKKLRKQRKTEKKFNEEKRKRKELSKCEMKQKKEKEKEYWKYLQDLPPKNMLEDKKATILEEELIIEDIKEEEDVKSEEKEVGDEEKPLKKAKYTCYTCGTVYSELHKFYDRLCTECAKLNYEKRNQKVDLKGKVALVTGGRVKIGYEIVLMLLRNNAFVIVTSRFPKDTALRFSKEKDFDDWKDRLNIYGLDFRHIPSVIQFTDMILEKYERLDILINNAAQTIKRPPMFYNHLKDIECKTLSYEFDKILPNDFQMKTLLLEGNDDLKNVSVSSQLSLIPMTSEDTKYTEKEFPKDALDINGQQIDLRTKNTWNSDLCEIPIVEFVEVQAINATAPFILVSRLRPLMAKIQDIDKWIINVSAMEGQFYRLRKTTKHVHTNMMKAALNMMTRTSGADFAKDRIYMNAVDTGWVTDERPVNEQTTLFTVPLDEIDGAARCLDPVFTGILTGVNEHSKFYKDYKKELW